MEIWKDVVGYEGLYQVSCRGRVKSLERYAVHSVSGQVLVRERILKQYLSKGHYPRVGLHRGGAAKTNSVHQLVCEAFIGPQPQGWHARHLNGDPNDNRAENLVYGEVKENYADSVLHGTNARGEICGNAKIKDGDVLKIRRLLADGNLTQNEIGNMFGVTQSNISYIKLRKGWKHLEETS